MKAMVLCPYCRSALEEDTKIVRCNRCGTRHHAACWVVDHHCSVYGCFCSQTKYRFHSPLLLFPAVLIGASSLNHGITMFFSFLLVPALLYSIISILLLSGRFIQLILNGTIERESMKNMVLHLSVNIPVLILFIRSLI